MQGQLLAQHSWIPPGGAQGRPSGVQGMDSGLAACKVIAIPPCALAQTSVSVSLTALDTASRQSIVPPLQTQSSAAAPSWLGWVGEASLCSEANALFTWGTEACGSRCAHLSCQHSGQRGQPGRPQAARHTDNR